MSRTQCRRCGATLKPSAQFCNICGTHVTGAKTSPTFQTSTEAVKCSNCGHPLKEGMKFCTKCGSVIQPISTMRPVSPPSNVCPNCGFNKNPASSNFCINCGQALSTTISPPPETEAEPSMAATAEPILTCPSCGQKTKSSSKFCIACGTQLAITTRTSAPSEETKPRPVKTAVPESKIEPIAIPANILASLMARGRQLTLEEEYAKNGAESDELFEKLSQAAGESDFEVEELIDSYINERGELERLESLREKGEVSERVYDRLMKEYRDKLDSMDERIKEGVIQLQGFQAQIQLDYAEAKEALETFTARLLIGDDEAEQSETKEKLSEKAERLKYALLASEYILKKEATMRNGPITRFEIRETTVADSKVVSMKPEESKGAKVKEDSEDKPPGPAPRSPPPDAEAGKICPQCGRVTASDAQFCIHCGGPL